MRTHCLPLNRTPSPRNGKRIPRPRRSRRALGVFRGVVVACGLVAGALSAAETPNNTPVILYSSGKENDLTDSVLQQLNAAAPPEAAPAPAKTDEKKK